MTQAFSTAERRRKAFAGHCMSLMLRHVLEKAVKMLRREEPSHMSENTIYNLRLEISQSNGTTWSWRCYPFIDLCVAAIMLLPQTSPVTARGIYRQEAGAQDDWLDKQIYSQSCQAPM